MKQQQMLAPLALLLAGCATASHEVQPAYVSPVGYQSYDCGQLAAEARRVTSRASQVAGVQDENRQHDAMMVGLAVVVAWPILFARTGDGATTAELSRLKGELDAIEQASNAKGCGIEFRQVAPAEPPPPAPREAAASEPTR